MNETSPWCEHLLLDWISFLKNIIGKKMVGLDENICTFLNPWKNWTNWEPSKVSPSANIYYSESDWAWKRVAETLSDSKKGVEDDLDDEAITNLHANEV